MIHANRSAILQYEVNSFKRYYAHLGIDAHQLAAFWIEKKKRNVRELNRLVKAVLQSHPPQAKLDVSDNSIESLIGLHRSFVEENCDILVHDISGFGNRFPEAVTFACKHSQDPTKQKKQWLAERLSSIPVMLSYDFSFEASVNVIERIIHFNKVIELIVDGLLAPIIANTLFSPQSGLDTVMMYEPSGAIDCGVDQTATAIACIASNVSQCKDAAPAIESALLSKSPAYLGFGFQLYRGVLEFILLHEYSHVLLGHEPGSVRKTDEVSADIFALNILLHKRSHFSVPTFMPGMEVGLAARALGPIVLMMFLAAVNVAVGLRDSRTHPHPLVRAGCMKSLIPHFLETNERAVIVFDSLCQRVVSVFDVANAQLGIPDRPYDLIDASFMNNVEFIMVDN